jgi:hypothetical protein
MHPRAELAASLRERSEEICEAVATRARAISDPREDGDAEYVIGLRGAIRAGVAYGIDALERGEGREEPIPLALLSQARLAARNKVPLDTMLRRYFAGHALFNDFLLEEAEKCKVRGTELRGALRVQAQLLDRLLASVRGEHGREAAGPRSAEERKAEAVKRLLCGEAADTSLLSYDLEITHVGLIARGPGAAGVVREAAASLDALLLMVQVEPETVWAWMGARSFDAGFQDRIASTTLTTCLSVAHGEPFHGLHGWRLTHRQASAAMAVALRNSGSVVRYAEVALLAASLENELLGISLCRLYLDPLKDERDGGEVARRTLRAYFDTGHQIAATAAALQVSRQTVNNRLRVIEEKLGRPLHLCAAELTIALRLDGFSSGKDHIAN